MSGAGAPLRVLVVEDEPLVAEAHRAFVDQVPGFRAVGVAPTARRALALLGQGSGADGGGTGGGTGGAGGVDLVLLDLGLPDAGGLEVLRAVRAAALPVDVIAVTAARDLAVVRAAVSLGVVHYLLKPFAAAALRERLRAYARFRAEVGARGAAEEALLGQEQIDAALAQLRPAPGAAARGISPATLALVVAALGAAGGGGGGEGLSAAEVAERTGLSRESARRYLEHLASAGRLERLPRYGGPGRPEVGYVPRPLS